MLLLGDSLIVDGEPMLCAKNDGERRRRSSKSNIL